MNTPPTDPQRVVVLGAAGFLGNAMARHLAAAGHQVVAYWRRPDPALSQLSNVESVIGDIRDTWILADALQGADVVYHFASATHPSLFFRNPAAEYWEALQPLLVLMETAARARVRRIVFPSSGGTIYSDHEPARSEDAKVDPRSPYAIFKLASEQLLLHAARQGDFAVDVYRVGNAYGPGQRARPGQGVLPHWLEAIQQQQPIRIFGDGTAERDYVYIDDFCQLMGHACRRGSDSDVFNLGTGIATPLDQLLRLVEELLGRQLETTYLDHSTASLHTISLAPHKLLAHFPDFHFTSLRDGLTQTLASYGLLWAPSPPVAQ
jgi:UDP-glucose 4-epimerase